jgi:uncharacterized protein YijF (DUF1287 family)
MQHEALMQQWNQHPDQWKIFSEKNKKNHKRKPRVFFSLTSGEMFSRKRKTVNLNTEAIDLKYTQAIAAKTLMRMRLQAGFVTPDRNIVIRTWPYEGMGAGAPATGERRKDRRRDN